MSLWNAPLGMANAVNAGAWIALIVGGLLTVLGTIAAFWSGGIRDRASDQAVHSAIATAATASESAEKFHQQNLTLQMQVEKERVARMKLEQALAPRQLSDEQRDKLGAALRPFAGHLLWVLWQASDPESEGYGRQIASVFKNAGWHLENESGQVSLGGSVSLGVMININEAYKNAKLPEAVIGAANGMFDAEITKSKTLGLDNRAPMNGILIVVGHKPRS